MSLIDDSSNTRAYNMCAYRFLLYPELPLNANVPFCSCGQAALACLPTPALTSAAPDKCPEPLFSWSVKWGR